jgi:hypothetical protein
VPHLALANEGLMLSILALGARHMSIKPDPMCKDVDRNVSVLILSKYDKDMADFHGSY